MNALDYTCLQLELECIGIDALGQLYRIPCANPDTLHRVYVVRCTEETHHFFRQNLPLPLRTKLQHLPFEDYQEHPERVKSILEEDAPCEEYFVGKSYIFSVSLPSSIFPDVVHLSSLNPEMVKQYNPHLDLTQKEAYGIVVDGKIVSCCESIRENERSSEAWVVTREAYRRRGYARQVAAAWGSALLQQGKVPFYSHVIENLASQALAESLGLVQFNIGAGYA